MPGTTRQQVAALSAALLIVLALGLPWTADTLDYIPGWMTPSFCTSDLDGSVWCTGGYISPGFVTGASALSGASSVARVFLVAALALTVLAGLRREPRWLLVGAAGLVAGILLVGLSVQGGQVATGLAAALLLYAGLTAVGAPARE